MDNKAFELLMKHMDNQDKKLDDLQVGLNEVKKDLSHYKGFLGGITFVFALLWSGFTYFYSKFGGSA